MRSTRGLARSLPLLAVLALAACGQEKANPFAPNYMGIGAPGDPNFSSVAGPDGDLLTVLGKSRPNSNNNGGGPGTGLGINAYLWRGALDTLGFMPLSSADPFGGVIITDWYSPPATPDERFKATAYILGRDLRSDSVKVSIFRQVLQNGQWIDAPVSQATVGDIEDKVLDRARKLREQAVASNS